MAEHKSKDAHHKDFIVRNAERISKEDIERVAREADAIRKRFDRPGPIGRFLSNVELMLAMVKDYWRGTYRDIPYWVICAIVFALLYVFNPMDLVPDLIPVAGQIDDILVIAACVILIEQQLQEYKDWTMEQAENPPSRREPARGESPPPCGTVSE